MEEPQTGKECLWDTMPLEEPSHEFSGGKAWKRNESEDRDHARNWTITVFFVPGYPISCYRS